MAEDKAQKLRLLERDRLSWSFNEDAIELAHLTSHSQ